MRLEDIEVTNTVFDELWPDELSTCMPLVEICDEDRITEKVFPFFVEGFSLAVVGKLGCEDSFDVFWVGGEDYTTASRRGFHGVGHACGSLEETVPCFEVFVVNCSYDAAVDKVEIYSEGCEQMRESISSMFSVSGMRR